MRTPTVKRIFEIINLVLEATEGLSFTEIQHRLALPKSTLSVLLGELVDARILCFHARRKTYVAGAELIRTGIVCRAGLDLGREVSLVLGNLADNGQAHFHAAVLNGTSVVYIAESAPGVRVLQNSIIALPAHACALGKMLLTQLDEGEIRTLYQNNAFDTFTQTTIASLSALLAAVADARKRGYVTDMGEFSPYVFCLAVPVCLREDIVAAISVTVPKCDDSSELVAGYLPVLNGAKREIEARIAGLACV